MNGKPLHPSHIWLLLGFLFMVSGHVLIQRSADELIVSGGTFENPSFERIQSLGLFLLVTSTVLIGIGAIYGSRKLPSSSAAATGTGCLAIAIVFWCISSPIRETDARLATRALVIPEFVWTIVGVVLLLGSGLKLLSPRPRV